MSIVSLLTPNETQEALSRSLFPKWATLCLLRSVGLPTLDAAFLGPEESDSSIERTIRRFLEHIKSDDALLRTDGGLERTTYPRGGNSFPLATLIPKAKSLRRGGRAVLVMEPTNRFANQLTLNWNLASEGTFCLEILGPGYDVSDLNRGVLPPHLTVRGIAGSWIRFESLEVFDYRCTISPVLDSERRSLRLQHLGAFILPGMGVSISAMPQVGAEAWLRSMGYLDLWKPWKLDLKLADIRMWFEDAFLIARAISGLRSWISLAMSASVLPGGRLVYWDVVDGQRKWLLKNI